MAKQAQIGPRPTPDVEIQPSHFVRKKDKPFGMVETPHNPAEKAKNVSTGGAPDKK
jgi:hypothetical protein